MVHVESAQQPSEAPLLAQIEGDVAELLNSVNSAGVPEVGDARHAALIKVIQDIGGLRNLDAKADKLSALEAFVEDSLPGGKGTFFAFSVLSAIESARNPEVHAPHSNNESMPALMARFTHVPVKVGSGISPSEVMQGLSVRMRALALDLLKNDKSNDELKASCTGILTVIQQLEPKDRVTMLDAFLQYLMTASGGRKALLDEFIGVVSRATDPACGPVADPFFERMNKDFDEFFADVNSKTLAQCKPGYLQSRCDGFVREIALDGGAGKDRALNELARRLMLVQANHQDAFMRYEVGKLLSVEPLASASAQTYAEPQPSGSDRPINGELVQGLLDMFIQNTKEFLKEDPAFAIQAGKQLALKIKNLPPIEQEPYWAVFVGQVNKLVSQGDDSLVEIYDEFPPEVAARLYPAARPAEVPDSAEAKVAPSNESMPVENRRLILNGKIDAFLERIRATTDLEKQWGENGMEFAGKVLPALINEIISGAADENKPPRERLVSQAAFLKRLDDGLKEIERTLPPVAMKTAVSQARNFFIKEYTADIDTLLSLQVDFVVKYGRSMTDEMRNIFTTNLVKTIRANAAEVDSLMERLLLGLVDKSQVPAHAVWASQLISLI